MSGLGQSVTLGRPNEGLLVAPLRNFGLLPERARFRHSASFIPSASTISRRRILCPSFLPELPSFLDGPARAISVQLQCPDIFREGISSRLPSFVTHAT